MPVKKSVKKTPARRANSTKDYKMVSFGCAISNFFKKYFQFSGVSTRAEYWWATLFVVLVFFVALTGAWFLIPVSSILSGLLALLWLMFCFVIIVPMWAVSSRRLHDAGFSAKILWVSFLFFVYSSLVPHIMQPVMAIEWLSFMWGIIMIVLFLMPSKHQDNPYRD